MKLSIPHKPSPLTKNHSSLRYLRGVDILIDTGAALSLIREDIVELWKEAYPRTISEEITDQKAETCSGDVLRITNKCTISYCLWGLP